MDNEYITTSREPCLCSECKYFKNNSNNLVSYGNCDKGNFAFADKEKCKEFKYWKEE